MKLELHRPICFCDLETTGTQIARDRIVEIAILKIFPNGDEESRTWKVNPEMPIPEDIPLVRRCKTVIDNLLRKIGISQQYLR